MKSWQRLGVVVGMALAAHWGAARAEEPTVESFAAEPVAMAGQNAWRIGDSRDLWSRCRIDGFQYASWSSRYELSKDAGKSWQPLTREASRGCHFDWLVRTAPGVAAMEPATPPAGGKPYDARASTGHLGQSDFIDVGGKLLIAPWLGVDAALVYGDDLFGGSFTAAGRDLGTPGLDLTLTGGQGRRSQAGQFGDYGRHNFTTDQEAWGGLLQYTSPQGSPLRELMPTAGVRATSSGTRDQTKSLSRVVESDQGLDTVVQRFLIAGGVLTKQEAAILGPYGLSLSLNHEKLAYSGGPSVDSGTEALLGFHGRPGGLTLDLDVGYADKTGDAIYGAGLALPALGGQFGIQAEQTPVTTQQQLSFSYGHCGFSLHHTEFKLGSKDDGVLVSCGLLGAPDMRGPGFGAQLASDLAHAVDGRGQSIADPVRGADIYSLMLAGDRVRIQQQGGPEVVARDQRPVARITGVPQTGRPGDSLTADGTGSSDAEGPIKGYAWSVSGPCSLGGPASGATVPAAVNPDAADGSICIFRLTVRDSADLTGSATAQLRVTTQNGGQPPTAHITGLSGSLQPGGQYFVDGSLSANLHGGAVSYQWQASGACTLVGATTTPVAQIRVPPNANGSCTVQLTVTNGSGQSSTTSLTAQVGTAAADQPPAAAIAGLPAKVVPGASYRVDGSGSSDPDGTVTNWLWQAGGDCTLTGAPGATASSVTVSSTPRAGFCAVYLTVTDNSGSQGSTAASAAVDRPPVAAIVTSGLPVAPGGTFLVDSTGSADPDGRLVGYAWTAAGPCSVGRGATSPNAGVTVTAAARPGSVCTVGLTVTDDDGQIGSTTTNVTVSAPVNQPPVASIRPASVAFALPGATLNLSGAGSSDPDGTIAAYSWSATGPCSFLASTGPASVGMLSINRAFAAGSVCNATLTVTDNLGATGSATLSIPLDYPPTVTLAVTAGGLPFVGSTQDLTASATDPDGTIASYSWSASGACGLVSSGGGKATVGITGPIGGTCTVQVIVTDNLGATATATQSIIVAG